MGGPHGFGGGAPAGPAPAPAAAYAAAPVHAAMPAHAAVPPRAVAPAREAVSALSVKSTRCIADWCCCGFSVGVVGVFGGGVGIGIVDASTRLRRKLLCGDKAVRDSWSKALNL